MQVLKRWAGLGCLGWIDWTWWHLVSLASCSELKGELINWTAEPNEQQKGGKVQCLNHSAILVTFPVFFPSLFSEWLVVLISSINLRSENHSVESLVNQHHYTLQKQFQYTQPNIIESLQPPVTMSVSLSCLYSCIPLSIYMLSQHTVRITDFSVSLLFFYLKPP